VLRDQGADHNACTYMVSSAGQSRSAKRSPSSTRATSALVSVPETADEPLTVQRRDLRDVDHGWAVFALTEVCPSVTGPTNAKRSHCDVTTTSRQQHRD
jgi:hypothetical protein